MTDVTDEVPVLIVGGGGAGLTTSILLSRMGVQSLLVERHATTSHLPKAHVLNQRTMEILREAGVADDVYKRSCPPEHMASIAWATSLAGPRPEHGRVIGCVDAFGGGSATATYAVASPCVSTNLPQIRLEPLLRQHAESLAPGRVLFHHEVSSIEQDADGVTAVVVDRDSGAVRTVRARYLVGADAGRTVGPTVGVRMGGLADLVDMVSCHITADLSSVVDAGTLIHFLINPDGDGSMGSGVLVKMGPEHWDERSEEWVFHALVPPGDTASYAPDFMPDLIRRSLGLPDLQATVHAVSHWRLEASLADRYQVGRVFLVGDAAHKHSPTTGLGLNSAVQDAHNLAWKLHAVLAGHAGEGLLDTYEAERRPVGRRNVERATTTFFLHMNIDAALGLAPDLSKEASWARLTRLFSDAAEDADLRERVAAAIADECHEFGAQNVDLGFTYTSSAVVHDASAEHVYADAVTDFHPQTRPGHRIPHAWLVRADERRSTFDLTGRGRFTLVVDVAAGAAWAAAAKSVAEQQGVPLDVLEIGGDWHDSDGTWAAQREVAPDGAVLVRPDQHVAWRSMTGHPAPADVLRSALRYVLSAG